MTETKYDNLEDDIENDEITLSSSEYNQILNIQQQILEMLASHIPTSKILSKLCRLTEILIPNCFAYIMVKEPDTDLITMKEAPSISRELKDRLTNLRAVIHGGSSGNAIFKNKVQFVEDTFTDE